MTGNKKFFTLTELAEYYRDRYGITSNTKKAQEAILQAMRQKLTRLSQEKKVGDEFLYDIMEKKKENEKGEKLTRQPRIITIELFEKHCFEDWMKYLEKNYGKQIENNRNWKIDLKRLHTEIDELKKYQKIADENNNLDEEEIARLYEIEDEINRYMEEHAYKPCVSFDDVLKKGHEMMLEAIFYKLFSGFDWEKLQDDMEWENVFDSNIGAQNVAESFRAIDRLKRFSKSFKHYVVENDTVDDDEDAAKNNA